MKKLFYFFAMSAIVLGLASCGDGNDPEMNKVPEGAIKGVFTVGENTKVYFAQGNVQASYDGYGWKWTFADNQWDFIGNKASNTSITGNSTISSNGTVDMFGWSTERTYYGIHRSSNTSDYAGGFEDWGKNFGSGWRTPKIDEWLYVFVQRERAKELCGIGIVNNVKGIILLPDNWKLPEDMPEFTPCDAGGMPIYQDGYYDKSGGDHYVDNKYTLREWITMESAGAVFLPATSERNGVKVGEKPEGRYWSATKNGNSSAYAVGSSAWDINAKGVADRYYGFAVRLICNTK